MIYSSQRLVFKHFIAYSEFLSVIIKSKQVCLDLMRQFQLFYSSGTKESKITLLGLLVKNSVFQEITQLGNRKRTYIQTSISPILLLKILGFKMSNALILNESTTKTKVLKTGRKTRFFQIQKIYQYARSASITQSKINNSLTFH